MESVQRVGREFGEVTEDSVMEIVNYDPVENITEMLENYSDSSSDDRDDEPEVLEKVTISKVSKIITDWSDMKESL